MTSLITCECIVNRKPILDCYKAMPYTDIICGIVLLILGTLVATGTITMSVGAMCAFFGAGSFLLGAGLATLRHKRWH